MTNAEKLSGIDIREVDSEDLVDIADINIHTEYPKQERIADYLAQIKNPYCYKSHGVIVKISFVGKATLDECLQKCISVQ